MNAPAILTPAQWHARRDAYADRVERLVGPYLRARRSGVKHPVLDFLFTYYSSRPAHVQRWHPGLDTVLCDADEYLALRGYHRVDGGVTADPDHLVRRSEKIRATVELLAVTAGRSPRFGCFGLHEWAMVYRTDATRHAVPLRLGSAGTDSVVESMPLRCTHFDAFRFFTDDARPRNAAPLSRDTQATHEQPGCLHATMDLYRACLTMTPFLPSELTLDAFEVALSARELDMRASPYDLREFGYPPVAIETPEGRAAYAREQTAIAERGAVVRAAVVERGRALLGERVAGHLTG
ncbi:3-methyladenine DNA glycosylase [Gordonia sp. ABSL49_1]|uniref:3-methyladenine DNA glycosylase n=1 Tax=unclassified Gordonia (in: high G+C Gram-positive bacteria) TaxID=2657482 RepID=UPI001F0F5581|nr:3-methyladenine DNA glycosylase [Gordonia sp. ABSL49_1]MCH5642663.1 3-methyladenine DNA glycosylase [Gordonia sp. ABSL49_1]